MAMIIDSLSSLGVNTSGKPGEVSTRRTIDGSFELAISPASDNPKLQPNHVTPRHGTDGGALQACRHSDGNADFSVRKYTTDLSAIDADLLGALEGCLEWLVRFTEHNGPSDLGYGLSS